MTESEAIKVLEFDKEMITFDPYTGEHRTPERVKAINEANYLCYLADDMAIKALEEIQEYRAIGTIEEFKALKEKATPKNPVGLRKNICPSCSQIVIDSSQKHCEKCGQAIKWSWG